MSVLIKDMKMPQGCIYESNDGTTKYCPMCDNNDVPYCKWLDDDDAAIGIDERPCYCPLVEVPPHGDLVDLTRKVHPNDSMRLMTIDEQLQRTCEGWSAEKEYYVIIPAEGSES